jgi:hypothetical protein
MSWDEDLEEGQDVADDVDTTLDVDSLLPEEAETHAGYFKALRVKIGVWYNTKYSGRVQKKKQQNLTFKQLFNKKELQPREPVKKCTLHFYSSHFYYEQIKPRVEARWATVSRQAKPPAIVNVRNQVTKEAWLAETQAFWDEVIESLNKEHEVAIKSYKVALANDVPVTAEEYSV